LQYIAAENRAKAHVEGLGETRHSQTGGSMKHESLWVSIMFIAAALIAAEGLDGDFALAQESKSNAKDQDEPQQTANNRRLAEMTRLAKTVKVTVREGGDSKEAKLIPKAIYRFTDPRLYSDGSLWAWVTTGRPMAMVELRTHFRNESVWAHDLVGTSDGRVSAQIPGRVKWAPQEPDFKLLPAERIGVPATSDAGRLRQMKRFAEYLSATKEWEGQRFELRLLPTEIYRYSDQDAGLVDGAAFAFADGSNPEAILFIEAHKSDKGQPSWKYGLVRMSAAALTCRLGDTDVWTVPRSFGGPRDTYYVFTRTVPQHVDSSD
jgi:hypothetical protein